jgi:acetolactate synthase-1/2/3 large subunit
MTTVEEQTGGEVLVTALEALGVRIAFGLPGVHNLPAWAALNDSPIRLVGVRHEQAAVYAADGAARITGELGVALTTTGPGAANALGATGEAFASGSPVLIVATDISTAHRTPGVYRGTLHETRDQGAMFEPVVKAVYRMRGPEDLTMLPLHAAHVAMKPPRGPVYLEIPFDLLSRPAPPVTDEPPPHENPLPSLTRAVELCDAAQRPLIWAGGGAKDAFTDVRALAARLGAPVLETYQGRGIGGPQAAGVPPHHPDGGRLWDEADLVIAIGSDLDGINTQNWLQPQPSRLIAINVDPADAEKNYPVDVLLTADAAAGTHGLTEAVAVHVPWATVPLNMPELDDDGFVAAFESAVDPGTIVFCDMCIPGYWIAGYRRFTAPRRLGYPMGWGTLGFAFPAAIGAALAQDRPTLCVCGDGGFLFAAGELAVVAQEQVPLTILLWNDGGYGMLRYDQQRSGDEPFGVDLYTPDFVQLAASFGIDAERIDRFDPDALRRHLERREPTMLVVDAPALAPPITTSPRWYRRKETA